MEYLFIYYNIFDYSIIPLITSYDVVTYNSHNEYDIYNFFLFISWLDLKILLFIIDYLTYIINFILIIINYIYIYYNFDNTYYQNLISYNYQNLIGYNIQTYYNFLDYTTSKGHILYYLYFISFILLNLFIIYLLKNVIDFFINKLASLIYYNYIKNSRFALYKVDVSNMYKYIFYIKVSPISKFYTFWVLLHKTFDTKSLYKFLYKCKNYILAIFRYIQKIFLFRSIHSWGFLIISLPLVFIHIDYLYCFRTGWGFFIIKGYLS